MVVRRVKADSDHLESLEQLRFALDVRMEIQIKINDVEWYIGFDSEGKRIISKDNGDFDYHFKDTDDVDEILDYVIDGKKIRDQWRDIVIVAM
ncbi:hypothetical protein DA799_14060 [Lactiplantibacillus plantarum]|nr:hypothetical protein [Lactiplantibacillus plantarum]MBO2713208.1 hypothetical protein [Lactiplantibacillus plantarum]PKX67081.1 hypothetical protein CUB88_01775 [Lactiplantibacillus plantarum]PTM28934.1 hypothetical protein DA799_14060 [Lactiplantibacillus plantarum]QLK64676.1 hypothetical protein LACP0422_04070 [Lactiplantibacillus plantarum]